MNSKSLNSVGKFLFCCCLTSLFSFSVNAQGDLANLVQYKEDATRLITGYTNPFLKPINLSLNQGWYNTAKPHKVAGVDLTLTVNAMYVPSSDKFYNVSGLNKLELVPGQTNITNNNVPTIFGPDIKPRYQPQGSTNPGDQFDGPQGLDPKKNIGINAVPVPMVQLGFGLPKGIDVKLRYFPKTSFGKGKSSNAQMYGLGVMHDIKQYIPGIKLLPFDLSAFVGYTHVQLNYDLSNQGVAGTNQKAVAKINATTIQAIISKKISVLTFYGSVGYNIAKTNVAINGTYEFSSGTLTNPYNNNIAASGARVSGGMRLKLAVFTLHADYTLQKYNCLSVGFGINVR
jgi:hypothetical protein